MFKFAWRKHHEQSQKTTDKQRENVHNIYHRQEANIPNIQEPSKIKGKKTKISIEKWEKDINRQFTYIHTHIHAKIEKWYSKCGKSSNSLEKCRLKPHWDTISYLAKFRLAKI